MLNLLSKEISQIKNIDSSLSERTLSTFLHSSSGSNAATAISTRSTQDLRSDFVELCDLILEKREEKEKVLADVEMLRLELGMEQPRKVVTSVQLNEPPRQMTEKQRAVETKRNDVSSKRSLAV